MKFMTFNTQHCANFLTGKIDYRVMADAILSCGADVVGLNEMRGKGTGEGYEAQVEKLAELTGMQHYYFAPAISFKGGPYGNGLLSKYPILDAKIIPIPDPDPRGYDGYYETRCLLKAELEGGVCVLISHFGLNPDEHELAVKTVVENLPERKFVLMGDFNMQPDDPVLRPLFERLVDTAKMMEGEKLSFPSDKPYEKIDYIFTSQDACVMAADIPAIVASDHRPHTAEITF